MKYLILLTALLLTTPALSYQECPCPTMPDEAQLNRHECYVNTYGDCVHAPAGDPFGVPKGATAKCRDGDYSFSKHRSGTCSSHHGVADWLKEPTR
jgi:Protein of unknown function (DUF3761)